jgi:hypothetical protein
MASGFEEIKLLIASSSERLEKKISEEMNNLKVTLGDMKKSIATNTTTIKKLDTKFEKHKNTCNNDRDFMHKMMRTSDQKMLSNDIVVKGFPTSQFDEHEVKQNIAAACSTEFGFNDCYKFSRQIGFDKDTKEPRFIHIVTLSFISHLDKMKVFNKLKDQGHFLLSDLISECPKDQQDQKIWIENALTIENLTLKKSLLQLKREGKIEGFAMRSGLFVVTTKDGNGRAVVNNFSELSQLHRVFPMTDNIRNEKRGRPSDSASPTEHAHIQKKMTGGANISAPSTSQT